MKAFLFSLFILLIASCSIGNPVDPEAKTVVFEIKEAEILTDQPSTDKPCEYLTLQFMENTTQIVKVDGTTSPGDTVWVRYQDPQYGWLTLYWVDGQVNWDCIALHRVDKPIQLFTWVGTDTCWFTIPPRDIDL